MKEVEFKIGCRSGETLGEQLRDSENLATIVRMYQVYLDEERHEGSTVFLQKLWAVLEPSGENGLRDFCVVAGWLDASLQKLEAVLPEEVLARVEVPETSYSPYGGKLQQRGPMRPSKSWRENSWPRW